MDLTEYDVNTVASLLKQYLRELPDPLIPLRLAPRLEAITSESWNRAEEVRHACTNHYKFSASLGCQSHVTGNPMMHSTCSDLCTHVGPPLGMDRVCGG